MRQAEAKEKLNEKILLLSVLKFPVLYLAGFFILKSRAFPILSIFTGLTLFFAAFLLTWILGQMTTKSKTVTALLVGSLLVTAPLLAAEHHDAHGSDSHAQASHKAEAHGEGHGEEHAEGHGEGGLHTTNLVGLVSRFVPKEVASFLTGAENVIFGALVIGILALLFGIASSKKAMIPGRLQSFCEMIVEGLNGFVCSIIGPDGRRYTPFLGTLFLYILTMNLLGLVPLMKANTANSITLQGPVPLPVPTTTVALAIVTFFVVQIIGITKQGIVGYLDHMAGTPRDVFGWVMSPLMFAIHIIGEFAKPFSLTFRLFCNTMGGHILVAVFIGMGVSCFVPFQAPFLLFEIATSTIQAFVFTLLSTVYIAMMLPHGDHEEHTKDHGSHDGHGHAKGAH